MRYPEGVPGDDAHVLELLERHQIPAWPGPWYSLRAVWHAVVARSELWPTLAGVRCALTTLQCRGEVQRRDGIAGGYWQCTAARAEASTFDD